MSNNDSGGGRNGDHGRQPQHGSQAGNREKRHRSPTTDSQGDNSHERSAIRRRDFEQQQGSNRQQLQTIDAMNLGQRLYAASIASQLDITLNTNEQMIARAVNAPQDTIWAAAPIQPSNLNSWRPRRRRMAELATGWPEEMMNPAPRNRGQQAPGNRGQQAPGNRGQQAPGNLSQQASESSTSICAICKGSHQTRSCCKLTGPYDLTDRRQGFKRWCPRHLTTSHTMDECKQIWDWIRDLKQLTQWLILGCVCSPAFATNLIDWRCLLKTNQPDVNFILFPWSPEFALKRAQEVVVGDNIMDRVDPNTVSAELRDKLPWQTENGQEPQFKSFAELRAHAEQEYSKFQEEMNRKRQLAAKKEEDDARVVEQLKQICIQEQSLGKQKKALLQQYANDPELMKRLGRIVETASLETCKEEYVERKIKKENDNSVD
ncbi:hypothetical protein F4680DRAFT_428317 [Xylaria scruposa]|nr:hypothetical protein F4680DRAFT_428317 [Xylaria scruposa]